MGQWGNGAHLTTHEPAGVSLQHQLRYRFGNIANAQGSPRGLGLGAVVPFDHGNTGIMNGCRESYQQASRAVRPPVDPGHSHGGGGPSAYAGGGQDDKPVLKPL